MKNKLKASYTKNTSCFENILCMIIKSEEDILKSSHEKVFLDHWHMNYVAGYKELGDRILFFDDYIINKMLINFQTYYGITWGREHNIRRFNSDLLLAIANKNDYIILCKDNFEHKNIENGSKRQAPHYVLVTGIENNGIHCLDYTEKIFLNKTLYESCAKHFILINIGQNTNANDLMVTDLKAKLSEIVINKTVFNNIKCFAESLNDIVNLRVELNSILKNEILTSRLIRNMGIVGTARYHFNRVIQNISNIPFTSQLANEEFEAISKTWYDSLKKLIRFKYNPKENIVYGVQKNIFELAEREEFLATRLLHSLEKDGYHYA